MYASMSFYAFFKCMHPYKRYIYNNASLVTQYLTSFKIMLLNFKKM